MYSPATFAYYQRSYIFLIKQENGSIEIHRLPLEKDYLAELGISYLRVIFVQRKKRITYNVKRI